MANLNVVVTVSEGKKKQDKKLTSFVIGESIVREELTNLNKENRQAKIREFAIRFLTPEQQALDFVCTATVEGEPKKEEASEEEVVATTEATLEPEMAHCD